MVKVYFGFDDTAFHDAPYGTGKPVRWFQKDWPAECNCLGVVGSSSWCVTGFHISPTTAPPGKMGSKLDFENG